MVVSAPGGRHRRRCWGWPTRAVAGERRDGIDRDVAALRDALPRRSRSAALGASEAEAGAAGERRRRDRPLASTSSASLLASLAALKELTPRTRDFVVSRGERLSAQIFAAALAAAGTPSRYVDATEIVFTDGPFGGASPNLTLTDLAARKMLRPLLAAGKVPVVPGFIGSADIEDDARRGDRASARSRRSGRGGSDLTATLLGRALGAREVSLWKDVPGLLTADPRVVPDARVIPQLHLREAAELAYYGAKVLHPRALIPVAGRADPGVRAPVRRPDARRAPRSRRAARWTSTRSRRCRRRAGRR